MKKILITLASLFLIISIQAQEGFGSGSSVDTSLFVKRSQTINGTALSGNITLTKSSFVAPDSATNLVQGFMTAWDHQQIVFVTVTTISYTTTVPLTKQTTIITGKILTTNDVFSIAASPVEGANATIILIGDGAGHIPDVSACDYIVGAYVSATGKANVITFSRISGKNLCFIANAN